MSAPFRFMAYVGGSLWLSSLLVSATHPGYPLPVFAISAVVLYFLFIALGEPKS